MTDFEREAERMGRTPEELDRIIKVATGYADSEDFDDSPETLEEFLLDVFTPTPPEPPETDSAVFEHAGRVCAIHKRGRDFTITVTTTLTEREFQGTWLDDEVLNHFGPGYVQQEYRYRRDADIDEVREEAEYIAEWVAEREAEFDEDDEYGRCPECGFRQRRWPSRHREIESIVPPRIELYPRFECAECDASWILTSGGSDG